MSNPNSPARDTTLPTSSQSPTVEEEEDPTPSTSSTFAPPHLFRNNLRQQQQQLCDYSDSSAEDNEDEGGRTKSVAVSPRKRRRNKQAGSVSATASTSSSSAHDADLGKGCPLDEEGNLDVNSLLTGDDFDVFAALEDCLDGLIPDFKSISVSRPEDLLAPESAKRDDGCRIVLEIDPDSLEVRQVVKRPREAESSEESEEEAAVSATAVSTDLAATSASVEEDEQFLKPKLRNRKFIFKPFVRLEDGTLVHNEASAPVDVVIPEQLAASYGLYLWPSAPVLSWYIWLHQDEFRGRRVLELGAGTSLPGLLCGKIGAERVWLADVATDQEVLGNCREAVRLNGLEETVEVVGVSWGCFEPDLLRLGKERLDFIIGSDLFYDPEVFEPLCITISFLLTSNPGAKVFIAVQDRSQDWSVEEHFTKWGLRGRLIYPREFLRGTGIEEGDLTGKHSIFILQIFSCRENDLTSSPLDKA